MGAASLASLCAVIELSDPPEPDRWGPMIRAASEEFILVRRAMEEYLVNPETAGLTPGSPLNGTLR